MLDSYNRAITYLRISVTDRCNLRCAYCMPMSGITFLEHKDILSFEEITAVVKEAIQLGITKIRLTGGEPLVRKNIVELVKQIAAIKGIDDLSMTTNGTLLEHLATPLKEAGLQRLNISLDTLNPDDYKSITKHGSIQDVFKGIEAAKDAGFKLIKLNCVLWKEIDKQAIDDLKQFAKKNNLELRFIHQMNLSTGEFSVIEGGNAGNCEQCNRLRLTADGHIKSCLFSNDLYAVRALGAKQALLEAIKNKPACGTFNNSHSIHQIGG